MAQRSSQAERRNTESAKAEEGIHIGFLFLCIFKLLCDLLGSES